MNTIDFYKEILHPYFYYIDIAGFKSFYISKPWSEFEKFIDLDSTDDSFFKGSTKDIENTLELIKLSYNKKFRLPYISELVMLSNSVDNITIHSNCIFTSKLYELLNDNHMINFLPHSRIGNCKIKLDDNYKKNYYFVFRVVYMPE